MMDEEKAVGNIREILPRQNDLIRPAVANVDQALVIMAAASPAPNLNLLDRFLITMQQQNVPCCICFNKQDLVDEETKQNLRAEYELAGYPVLFASAAKEEGPYTEDMVNPGNIYAQHKLEMEQRVLDIDPDAVMLRAEWMYDYYFKKSNYFMNIINATDTLAFSSQQFRGITYVKEVAENMEKVISLPGGAYNFGSETSKSMYDITKDFLALTGKNIKLFDAEPRHNLWMNCNKAKRYGVEFSSVEEGLAKCAKDYGIIKNTDR